MEDRSFKSRDVLKHNLNRMNECDGHVYNLTNYIEFVLPKHLKHVVVTTEWKKYYALDGNYLPLIFKLARFAKR